MRMSAGSRWKRARSRAAVSPVRTETVGRTCASPRPAATFATPRIGARRFRSTSTASALSGDTYTSRHRRSRGGGGANISRSMHARNAASVFPLPVGASSSAESPRAMTGQPSAWGGVGPAKEARNQSRTAGWKWASGSAMGARECNEQRLPGPRRIRTAVADARRTARVDAGPVDPAARPGPRATPASTSAQRSGGAGSPDCHRGDSPSGSTTGIRSSTAAPAVGRPGSTLGPRRDVEPVRAADAPARGATQRECSR